MLLIHAWERVEGKVGVGGGRSGTMRELKASYASPAPCRPLMRFHVCDLANGPIPICEMSYSHV